MLAPIQRFLQHSKSLLIWNPFGDFDPFLYRQFASVGIATFLTSLLASLSLGYALYLVFNSIALPFAIALFWGAIIFNFDRFLIQTNLRSSKHSVFALLLTRLILSIALSFVIVIPIELRIFQGEIETELAKAFQLTGSIDKEILEKKTVIEDRMNAIEQRRAITSRLYDEAYKEAFGTGSSGITGRGPVYREKLEEALKAKNEANKFDEMDWEIIKKKEAEISKLEQEKSSENPNNFTVIQNGFLSHLQALQELHASNPAVYRLHYLFVFLFTLLNATPILMVILIKSNLDNIVHERTDLENVHTELQEAFDQALDHSTLSPKL
jgi:hypothetical protein